jgi:hypothetical protein
MMVLSLSSRSGEQDGGTIPMRLHLSLIFSLTENPGMCNGPGKANQPTWLISRRKIGAAASS